MRTLLSIALLVLLGPPAWSQTNTLIGLENGVHSADLRESLGALDDSLRGLEFAGTTPSFYLGFDRNEYPGDQNLKQLRNSFSYAGYWLNNPPGSNSNSWMGKRGKLEAAGFGYLVLFNGRLFRELRSVERAAELGRSDAKAAARSAGDEGFPAQTILFLDQEEGGTNVARAKSLFVWLGRRSTSVGLPGGCLLLWDRSLGKKRRERSYSGRHTAEFRFARDHVLGDE